MKINDRIEMITNSSVNCYLVKGSKESVLIDTGYYMKCVRDSGNKIPFSA